MADALRLSTEDRVELAEALDFSLEDHKAAVERGWIAEAQRRLENLEAGRTKAIPWDEAMVHLRERLRQCR